MHSNDKLVDDLNSVLQGERAAAETYVQVLSKIGDNPKSDPILYIKSEHFEAVQTLKDTIESIGGEPKKESGTWGTFAEFITGASKILGDKAALKALKEGEEHGLKQYEDLCETYNGLSISDSIRHKFIPRQKKHIQVLNELIDRI